MLLIEKWCTTNDLSQNTFKVECNSLKLAYLDVDDDDEEEEDDDHGNSSTNNNARYYCDTFVNLHYYSQGKTIQRLEK